MELHVATHTGEKPFACPHCPFRAVHSANLKTHIRTHTGEKPFACPYCPYSAAQKEKLKAHIRTHTGEKPFACEYCPYRSTRKDHLKSHVRLRHSQRINPPACQNETQDLTSKIRDYDTDVTKRALGDEGYQRASAEGRREIVVDGGNGEMRSYECCFCSYRSFKRFNYERHMRTHTGERPYSCPHCPYRATRKISVDQHMIRHH
ncbi:zinc finger protein 513-like [Penaeus japonicus]|uniref:zinc finger protein 513-like n=1 Tax=Penaeus japonicus TaxID=27405 RepID=UPI001C715DF0|nr:zinc finger protein 513-like [Penaeus japonicus]